MSLIRRLAYSQGVSGNIIRVSKGQEPSGRAWVLVRRSGDEFRVTVDDPRNPNPVTLGERFGSFWAALLSARTYTKKLGVPVHAVGCKDA